MCERPSPGPSLSLRLGQIEYVVEVPKYFLGRYDALICNII